MYNTKQQDNPEHYQITLVQYKISKKKVNKSFLMDNLCVNVRKVNKGEKQPFTIKLFQKRTDESKLPIL